MDTQEVAKQLWKQIREEVESDEDNFDEETGRCRVSEESLYQALEEVKAIQEGRLPRKSWREAWAELRAELEAEENFETDDNRIHAAI